MRHVVLRLGLALSIWIAGCDEPSDEVCAGDDPNVPDLHLVVTGTPTFELGADDVTVQGTSTHDLGMTVRRVMVGGVDATSGSFNYGSWSAEIPAAVIESLLDPDAELPAEVELAVVAFDPCNEGKPATTAEAKVRVVDPAP